MRIGVFAAYAALLLFVSCAQIISPTGGPKDETPPKVVSESPANRSVNFTAKKIEIGFDEFIVFQNPSEHVIISPPMQKTPEYTLVRKSLVIKLQEELTPNATYIINFGEAIKDNNENNILNNYTYVFSTGEVLDSMELKGKLTDAITAEPVEGAMLMLYRGNEDSLPKTTLPDYFARTGKDGQFHITNIPDMPYKLFALKDQNTNYKFDVPDEMVGFVDTLVRPTVMPRPAVVDSTVTQDSTAIGKDTLGVTPALPDSADADVSMRKGSNGPAALNIRMFVEEDTTQFLKKSSCEHFGKLVFVYNRPVSRFTALLPAGKVKGTGQWAVKEFSAKRDTVTLWTTDAAPDTLDLIVTADLRKDTVQLAMKAKTAAGTKQGRSMGRKSMAGAVKTFGLSVKTEPTMGKPPKPDGPITLIWNHPVTNIDLEGVELREDSVLVNFELTSSDTALRRFEMTYPWKVGKKYQVHITDSAVTDLMGLRNDTVKFEFTAIDAAQLGDITLKVSNLKGQRLLELIDGAKRVVATRTVVADGELHFKQLDPGKYSLVMVDDLNGNGRWDPGRYAFRLQPEPIIILKTDIEVRANWQMELEWDAQQSKLKD